MILKKLKWLCVISIIILLNCNEKDARGMQNIIREGAVQEYSEYQFVIRFSNLIYEQDGKEIKIPIFKGNMGDVSYKAFRKYCVDKKYLEPDVAETSLIIKADKGNLTKTFHEFLMFYKGNILKNSDISKPAKIKVDGGALDIFYDFKVSGVPFVLQINVGTDKNEIDVDLIKSILDIKLNENVGKPIFQYRFWKNYTSDEF